MMRTCRRVGGLVVVTGLLLLTGQQDARSQGRGGKIDPKAADAKTYTDDVTVPTNRESRRLIQAAQDYIRKKDWPVVVESLQSLLEAKEDSFIELDGQDEKGTDRKRRVSVRIEANRLIGELPPAGLQHYELAYGQAAADRLKEALEKNDPSLLAEVAFRYLHTRAGAEATNLLGTYHLDRGNYLMAALSFERLLSRPDPDKLPARVLFKAALAFRRAGDAESAEKVWKRLADKAGRGDLVLGRQKVTLDRLRAEYERAAELLGQAGQSDWWVFRGNPARTAQGVGSTAYLEPRWQFSLTPLDETNPNASREQIDATHKTRELLQMAFLALEHKPLLPALFPVAAGDKLIFRTYDGVYAVALKDADTADGKVKAGELLWASPAQGSLHALESRSDKRLVVEAWYKGNYATQGPAGVLFEDAAIGSLSHDGQRVYFVDDLAVPPHPTLIYQQNFGGAANNFQPLDSEVHFSRLTALELDTGRVLWTIGGRSPAGKDGEEKKDTGVAGHDLLDTFFLAPPLPLGGRLYVLVEKNTELRLVCLDPAKVVTYGDNLRSPEVIWQQSLGTANRRLTQDTLRRLQAAHLAYADGILVCPTNAGVVLGVDLLSHSLVWAHSYRDSSVQIEEMPIMRRGRGMPFIPPTASLALERWRPAAPAIQNGKVVFTAHDATALHCLNLRDGRLLWEVKRREDDLYLAGVFGPRVVIVGKSSVRALNLDDGKELWSLPTGSLPSGQGAASDDVYYLPLQKAGEGSQAGPAILAISLATGKPVAGPARSRKKEPLGNLLFVEGELVSQTAQAVAAFPELKRMLAEIDRRLKQNPNDPIGLAERGELYLDKGDLGGAITDLRTALAHKPPSDTRTRARTKLHEALTELLQKDFAAAERYLDEYKDLCRVDVPSDADTATRQRLADEQLRREANYLSLLGRGRERQGRLLDAFDAYEQFGALTGNKELVSVIDEPSTKSRPDVWSRGRITGMIDHATPEQKKQLEDAIAKRWQALHGRGDLDAMRKFVAVFGTHFRVGREAQLQLAERLIAAGGPDELTEAENKLQTLCFSPDLRRQDPATAARSIEAMIRLYIRRGHYEDAVGFYKQLGTEFATVPVRDGKTGADLLNELFTDKRFLPYLEPQGVIWKGALKAHEVPGQYPPGTAALTVVPQGELLPFFQRHRLVLDANWQGGANGWQLRLLDRVTNEERWKKSNLPAATYILRDPNQSVGNLNNPRVPRYAFAQGHMLVLQLNNMVYAFDLAERKELWSYNLFGKNPLLNNTPHSQISSDPEGRLTVIYPDGRQERIGGVAVVEPNYVCLQTRDGLVALDPTRPGASLLWNRTNVSLRAQVFGDDQHVYVFDPGPDNKTPTALALRAQDGAAVPVPDFSALYARRMHTFGRRLLLQEDDAQGGKVLRLYDVHTGQDVWRSAFSPGALVMHSEDPHLAGVVEKDHTVTLLDTSSGQVLFRSLIQAEHADRLQAVALVADDEHLFLALSRTPENGLSWRPNAGFGMRALPIHGPLYALNRHSGKLEWVCDFLPHQSLLLEQVHDLPLLLFATQYSKTANGAYVQQAMRVTAVDKRTGKLLYDKEWTSPYQFHALRVDPRDGAIDLVRQDLKISFRLEASPTTVAERAPGRARPPRDDVPNVGGVLINALPAVGPAVARPGG